MKQKVNKHLRISKKKNSDIIMRQFQSTYLYRATAIRDDYSRTRRTFYMIAANEREAEANSKRQLKSDEELSGKPSNLGRQYGDYFFKE